MLDSTSSCDAFDSDDQVYAALPLRRATVLAYQRQKQQRHQQQLPQMYMEQISIAVANRCYPWIAGAFLVTAFGLIVAPQQALQLFGALNSNSTGPAGEPLLVSFAQLLGATNLLQGAMAMVVQVGTTSCMDAWKLTVSHVLVVHGIPSIAYKVCFGDKPQPWSL